MISRNCEILLWGDMIRIPMNFLVWANMERQFENILMKYAWASVDTVARESVYHEAALNRQSRTVCQYKLPKTGFGKTKRNWNKKYVAILMKRKIIFSNVNIALPCRTVNRSVLLPPSIFSDPENLLCRVASQGLTFYRAKSPILICHWKDIHHPLFTTFKIS